MASTVHGTTVPDRAETRARPGVSLTDLLLLLMALIWGVNLSVVKFGTTVLDPLAYNGARVALAAAALLAVATVRGGTRPARRDAVALLALGALGNGVYQLLFIEGIARTRAGNVALVLAATPAFIALIGRGMRVERVSARGFVGIAASVAGIAMVIFGAQEVATSRASLMGDALVLVGALCWSLFSVLLRPYTERVDGVRVAALTMAGGAVLLLLVSAPAIAAADWLRVPGSAWLAIAYSGLGALVVAYLFWYRGVRVLGPTRTAMYGNLQPIIALLVAWVALQEVPTLWQGLGTASIIAGVFLTRS
jgi:drug/metabolite transporter (DMT)-like permease